jgi:predicted outer membrane repeat protein
LSVFSAGEVERCNFTANAAQFLGGAITAADYSTLSVQDSIFFGNKVATRAEDTSSGAGMAVTESAAASVTHSIFASNRAQNSGGGIYLSDNGWLSVVRTLFVRNTAELGGAMLLSGNSSATLTAVRLHSNVAVTMGGAVLGDYCTLSCYQSWFLRNTAGSLGGAIAATSNATFVLRNCTLLSNKGSGAGALYLGSSLAHGNVFAVTAINNSADQGGFALVSDSAVLNVSGGTFRHNFVSVRGQGGLLYASDMAVVNLKDCMVSGGAQGPLVIGGAVRMDGRVRLTLSSCTIAGYNAQFGGGLWSHGSSSVHAHNCIWQNLAAEQSGGAVFLGGDARSTLHGG